MTSGSEFPATPSATAPAKKRNLVPDKIQPAVVTMGVLAALMVVIQAVNSLAPGLELNRSFGLIPRRLSGLDGVLFAPLLHGNWWHLLSNLVPFVIFGLLLFAGGVRQFVVVTALVWLLGGLALWLVGPSAVTIGMSGVIFGWLAYLLARGLFTRNIGQLLIGLVLLVLYGGMLISGILGAAVRDFAGVSGVSWQGHLCGALAGVLAAFLVAKADAPRRQKAAG